MLYFLKNIKTSDIPHTYTDGVRINGTDVRMVPQRVGYGYKRLFLCPQCGARRERLILAHDDSIWCRGCCPVDPYADRRNLYDEGGQALIVWHMYRTADKASIDIKFPFKYYDHLDTAMSLTPKKAEKFCEVLQRLQVLECMRFCAITWHTPFTATDIKRYTDPEFAGQITLADWERYIVFRPDYHPQEIITAISENPLVDFMGRDNLTP